MSGGRLEFKVGLFVIVLLGLAAVMSIKFSETGFGLRPTFLADAAVSSRIRAATIHTLR